MLRLDGCNTISEREEFVYHENLIHPALTAQAAPRNVLIIGGGDGGACEEVLKHPSVEQVTVCEIDEDVIRVAKEYFFDVHRGAFDDPRLRVVIGDGMKFIRETQERFDLIALDLNDPIMSLFGATSGQTGNMTVDSLGTIWLASPVNGQYIAVAADKTARAVYVNREITSMFDVENSEGVASDPDSGALYIVTSGPESSYGSGSLVCHIVSHMPAPNNFLDGAATLENGWSPSPLYIENEGIDLTVPGEGLIKGAGGPLYFIGRDQLYEVRGAVTPFGPKFDGLSLKGGAADSHGNLYLSACDAQDAEGAKGDIYRVDPDGNAAIFLKGVDSPRGLAWRDGCLYFVDGAGGRILKVGTQG
jgi:hypothetical protein